MLNKDQKIIVDSYPRMAKVQKGQIDIGTTPFFYKLSSKNDHRFKFSWENEKEQNINYKCKLNWTESILPDLYLALASPILSGALLVSDFVWDGMYKCEDDVFSRLSRGKSRKNNSKNIYIALPYSESVGPMMRRNIQNWIKKNKQYLGMDSEVKIDDRIWKDFMRFGIDGKRDWTPNEISKSTLIELGEKYKATHILSFSVLEKKGKTYLKAKKYDAFKLKRMKLKQTPVRIKTSKNGRSFFKKIFDENIFFIPNSVTISNSMYTGVETLSSFDDATSEIERNPDDLPKILSIFGMSHVDNPNLYSRWDYKFKLAPSFTGNAYRVLFDDPNKYVFQNIDWMLSYGLIASLFTPYLNLEASYSIGGVYYNGIDNIDETYSGINLGYKMDISLYWFIKQKYYAKLYFEKINYELTLYDVQYKLNGFTSIGLALGVYFPSIVDGIIDLLPF